jgi:hypothetical protein
MWLEGGTIQRGVERTIPLDGQISGDPELNDLLEEVKERVRGARRALQEPEKASTNPG